MNCNNVNKTLEESQQKIVVQTTYGALHIDTPGNAQDHVAMKIRELHAFFVLVSGEGQENFSALKDDLQNSLLWMAQQAASELEEILSQVDLTVRRVTK